MPSRRDFLLSSAGALGLAWMKPGSESAAADVPAVETGSANEYGRLFPSDLTPFAWQEFRATGFSVPATGIIYQIRPPRGGFGHDLGPLPRPVSGVPLGGIDTGGLYLDGPGTLGYTSIFNHYSPPGGPLNTPYLGIGIAGHVCVLATSQTKTYAMNNLPSSGPALAFSETSDMDYAEGIDYWGHYPMVDMQYKTSAPVKIGLRAWAPFVPGDSNTSNIPGAVFEVHLTNPTQAQQAGTLAFSFPGFHKHRSRNEVIGWPNLSTEPMLPKPQIERRAAPDGLSGTWVEEKAWGMSYVLAAIDEKDVRSGGELGTDASKWSQIEKGLPAISEGSDDGGSSLAVSFSLEPDQEKVIRIILAWYAPEWEGAGSPGTGSRPILTQHFGRMVPGSTGKRFTHMYASRFGSAGEVARNLAQNHRSLLQRIVAWQSVLYSEAGLPGWLADTLINAFYYFAPCSVWAQAKPPIGNWCKPEDGVFALNEAPRACAHMSTLSNLAIAGPVLSMFFPDLALSSLRAFRAAQNDDGDLPQLLGLWMDVATPLGYGYQEVMMGSNYIVQLYWQWKATGDDRVVNEFYASAKRMLEHNFNLNPSLGISQIIAMPAEGGDRLEWFEDRDMYGYQAHAGGYRLAATEMMMEWAQKMGDVEYEKKLQAMLEAGKNALEKHLWRGDHYLVYSDPKTGKNFDAFFSPQLDGQYFARISGVPGVFPKQNIEKVIAVLRSKVCKISKFGLPPVYANPDGSIWSGTTNAYLTGKYLYTNTQVIWIAVLAMYEGHKDFGLDLLRKNLELGYCRWGYMWDGVNCCSAYGDTGEVSYGWDYWFNWSVWMAAAALKGRDFTSLLQPGGLANRVIRAGNPVGLKDPSLSSSPSPSGSCST